MGIVVNPKAPLDELGTSGLQQIGGFVYEEPLPELSSTQRMRVFKLMRENDPIIFATMHAIEMLIRKAAWQTIPVSDSNEDMRAAEYVDEVFDDMSSTREELMSEISTFLQFGFGWNSIVYKLRRGDSRDSRYHSKYDDGLVGWRKLPGRAQETLWNWNFDSTGGIKAFVQYDPWNNSAARNQVVLPIERSLLFRTTVAKNNPEGRSALRGAYRPWLFKRRIEEIEGIGIERDLAGLPTLTPPEGVDLWSTTDDKMKQLMAQATEMVQKVRRDEMEGLVIPFGWVFSLMSTGGRRQIDVSAVIERYNRVIAMTVLADSLMMGHERIGSFALADNKQDMLDVAIEAWRNMIADVFNQYGIPRLFRLNPSLAPSGRYPKIRPMAVGNPSLKEIGEFIKDTTGSGALLPDPTLDEWLRGVAKMPKRIGDATSATDMAILLEVKRLLGGRTPSGEGADDDAA